MALQYIALALISLAFLLWVTILNRSYTTLSGAAIITWISLICIIAKLCFKKTSSIENSDSPFDSSALLSTITSMLHSSKSISDILNYLCKSAVDQSNVESAFVYVVNSKSGDASLISLYSKIDTSSNPIPNHQIPNCEESVIHQCIKSNQMMHCNRDQLASSLLPFLPGNYESILLIPLALDDSVCGVFAVCAHDFHLVQNDASINSITELIVLAIIQSEELKPVVNQHSKIRDISEIMSRATPQTGISEVKKTIIEAGRVAMETELIALFTIDPFLGSIECESTASVGEALQASFLDLFGNCITDIERNNAWEIKDITCKDFPNKDAQQILLDSGVRGIIACPIRSEMSACGALVAFYHTGTDIQKDKYEFIEAIAIQASTAISYAMTVEQSRYLLDDLAGANQELSQQATIDGLTGLANHRTFQQTLSDIFKQSSKGRQKTFCLAMVDVDHFKIFNDTHGHQEGDAVLQRVAKSLASGLRQGDLAARYGGEEFVLIFQNIDKANALVAAERIRRSVADQIYRKGSVTISIGLAEYPCDGSSPNEIIENADKALYHAKITGRNRVFCWGSSCVSNEEETESVDSDAPQTSVLVVAQTEENESAIIKDTLTAQSYRVESASAILEATELLKTRVFDIALVSRESLPNRDIKSLGTLAAMHPHMPIVLLSSSLPLQESRESLRKGASDILLRPFNPNELPVVIERNLERKRLERQKLMQKGTGIMLQAIDALVAAIDAKDPYTAGHTQRVSALALSISDELNIPSEDRYALELASKLHDIGKLALPDSALNKQSPLTEEEWEAMREHPAIGAKIVGAIDELAYVSTIIRHHHERLDGTGYPDGLRRQAIPYLSRIIAVADAYEAMISERAHRSRLTPSEAIQELNRHAGTYYSPEIINVLKKHLIEHGDIVENSASIHAA